MADIVVTTDFSQLNSMNKALGSTDTLFVKVVDSILREANRAKRVTKALAQTTEENLKIIELAEVIVAAKVEEAATRREKARQREADRAEKEAKRIEAANKRAAESEARLAREVEANRAASGQRFTANLNQNLGVTGKSAMESGAGFSAMEAEIERLRQKYDQVYASSQLYERSLNEINQAHTLGAINAKQQEAAVENLNAEYQAFQNGVAQAGNRFVQHVNQTSDGMNKFGVVAQQTGYQVGDLIVQIQSGTNPLVAFSQQATQLAGLLYLLPPAAQAARIGIGAFSISMATATAGITILIPLLSMIAMSFFTAGKEAKNSADGPLKAMEERVKSLDSALKDYSLTKKALSLGITVDELVSQQSLDQAKARLKEAEVEFNRVASEAGVGKFRGIGAVKKLTASDDPAIKAAEQARAEAALRVLLIEQRMEESYRKQEDQLRINYELESARIKFGEESFEFKQKQAEADRLSYEEGLKSEGLNATRIGQLMAAYDLNQRLTRELESQAVALDNQRASESARAKERLAAEQEYQSAIDKTLAKNQYWSDQAKAAERQAAAVEYIVNNLSLLGAKKDAEGFNKAMEDALAAGVQFSLVDLSSIVALAARNGWDLAASLQAAYRAATQKNPVAASVLTGAGGRPEINLNNMEYRGAVIAGQQDILQ